MIEKENEEEIIKEDSVTPVIRGHADADGIVSSIFTAYKYPYPIEIWYGTFGDTTGMAKGSVLCDMHPTKDFSGIVVDHHQLKDYPLKRSYELICDDVPAGLVALNAFKDEIPKSEWWKVAIACVGDVQAETIPYYVYKECPQLLNRIKSYSSDRKSYGKWTVSSRQTIDLLSSPVNSLLRIGEHEEALKLVMEAKSPNDILNSPAVRRAKAKVNDDIKKIISNINHVEFQNLVVVPYYSDYKMSGYVSATLGDTFDGKTILAFNIKDGRGSIRGKLCHYWRDRFKDEKGFDYVNINGHPKACGCSIKVNAETFIEDLTKLLN